MLKPIFKKAPILSELEIPGSKFFNPNIDKGERIFLKKFCLTKNKGIFTNVIFIPS